MITNLSDPRKMNHKPATGKAKMLSELHHKQNSQDTTRIPPSLPIPCYVLYFETSFTYDHKSAVLPVRPPEAWKGCC